MRSRESTAESGHEDAVCLGVAQSVGCAHNQTMSVAAPLSSSPRPVNWTSAWRSALPFANTLACYICSRVTFGIGLPGCNHIPLIGCPSVGPPEEMIICENSYAKRDYGQKGNTDVLHGIPTPEVDGGTPPLSTSHLILGDRGVSKPNTAGPYDL